MGVKISGIVIDQTRTEGKWYVRELKDENGGVTPMFFRREKSDLIGRLIDKFKGAKSAQRYAASHMAELGFGRTENMNNVSAANSEMVASNKTRNKLESTDLQNLLDIEAQRKFESSLLPASDDAAAGSRLPVTVMRHKPDRKRELDLLWAEFEPRLGASKSAKNEFYTTMALAIGLYRRDLTSSDPKLWDKCEKFLNVLAGHASQMKSSTFVDTTLADLHGFFDKTVADYPEFSQLHSMDKEFWNPDKIETALTEIWEAQSDNPSMTERDFKQALRQIVVRYLLETSLATANEATSTRLTKMAVALDGDELNRLLTLALKMRADQEHHSSPDSDRFMGLLISALEARLKKQKEM